MTSRRDPLETVVRHADRAVVRSAAAFARARATLARCEAASRLASGRDGAAVRPNALPHVGAGVPAAVAFDLAACRVVFAARAAREALAHAQAAAAETRADYERAERRRAVYARVRDRAHARRRRAAEARAERDRDDAAAIAFGGVSASALVAVPANVFDPSAFAGAPAIVLGLRG